MDRGVTSDLRGFWKRPMSRTEEETDLRTLELRPEDREAVCLNDDDRDRDRDRDLGSEECDPYGEWDVREDGDPELRCLLEGDRRGMTGRCPLLFSSIWLCTRVLSFRLFRLFRLSGFFRFSFRCSFHFSFRCSFHFSFRCSFRFPFRFPFRFSFLRSRSRSRSLWWVLGLRRLMRTLVRDPGAMASRTLSGTRMILCR